jgi:hypothetical protein
MSIATIIAILTGTAAAALAAAALPKPQPKRVPAKARKGRRS